MMLIEILGAQGLWLGAPTRVNLLVPVILNPSYKSSNKPAWRKEPNVLFLTRVFYPHRNGLLPPTPLALKGFQVLTSLAHSGSWHFLRIYLHGSASGLEDVDLILVLSTDFLI